MYDNFIIIFFFLSENEIDDDTFLHLESDTIRELIPKVGRRIKFLQRYKDFMTKATNKTDDEQIETVEEPEREEQVQNYLTCFKCLASIRELELFKHIQYVHNINTGTNTHIVCPECLITFNHCKTYKRHVKKLHFSSASQEPGGNVGNLHPPLGDDLYFEYAQHEGQTHDDSSCESEDGVNDGESLKHDQKDKMAVFLASLKSKSISTSTIKIITENVQDLIASTASCAQKKINNISKEWKDGSLNEESFTNALEFCDSLKDPFAELKLEKSQLEYFKEKGALILPVDRLLGDRYVPRLNRVTGRMEQVKKEDTFQYVPIDEVLKAYLEQPGMMRTILNESAVPAEDGILKSYRDGEFYKGAFKEQDDLILPFLLYNDDFETANPLGSRRGIHKLCAFYLSLICLPRKYQSSLNNVLLVALVKSKYVTEYGIDTVLDVICDELQRMYNDGIAVHCQEFNGVVRPKLFQVIGDNLAVNSVLGFSRGFTANYFCRECRTHRNDCQEQVNENKDKLRTKQNFEEDLALGNLSLTGVATNSSLKNLSYFHAVESSTFDIMHDMLEGVVPLTVKLVITHFIDEGAFTLEEFNSRLTSFSYGFSDKQNCPTPMTMASLMNAKGPSGQKAAQMNCLFKYLGLLIGDKVDRDHLVWEVICSLQDVYKLLQAPSLSVQATFMLQAKIAEYLQLYKDTFNMSFTPKQHFLVHYARSVRMLGPLNAYTCMRFEAKHKELKQMSSTSNNFKNVAKTVAKKHQVKQCYGFLVKQDVEQRHIEVLSQDVIPASMLQSAETVCAAVKCPLFADITLVNAVTINGYTLRPNTCVLLEWDEDLPRFGEVQQIVTMDGTIYLSYQPCTTLYYDRHFCAYAVTSTADKLQVVQANELEDHKPVHLVQSYDEIDQNCYIAMRYQLA